MNIAVNCTAIDTSRTLGVLRFGQRLVRAISSAGHADVVGLVPAGSVNDPAYVGTFTKMVPVHGRKLRTNAFDVELLLHHFQTPCTRASTAMVFHDLHLWDVPWKYDDPERIRRTLRDTVDGVEAIIVHFPRTYYDLPKVMPEVANRLFLTVFPTMIEYTAEDAELTFRARAAYGISEREKVILYPAQLQPHKNHLALFRAMKILERLPIKLICTGSELQKSHAVKLSEFIAEMSLGKRIIMTGRVADRELENMYHLADLVAFPSLAEDGATIAQEALVYRKNIVYSDIRAVRLHLEKMRASIPLFHPLDPKGIAEAVSSTLNGVQDNTEARATVLSWTWERLAQQYYRVLEWLSAGKPNGKMPMFLDDTLGYLRKR